VFQRDIRAVLQACFRPKAETPTHEWLAASTQEQAMHTDKKQGLAMTDNHLDDNDNKSNGPTTFSTADQDCGYSARWTGV
jgi:hypothetical protein